MEITHKTQNLHIAPRKLRLVADKVRHMPASEAMEVLPLVVNKGAGLTLKSLKSAVQVAKDRNLNLETLQIQRIWCDEGMRLKRVIGHSRGRMAPIRKHYSHLSIVLSGEEATTRSRSRRVAKPATETPNEITSGEEQ